MDLPIPPAPLDDAALHPETLAISHGYDPQSCFGAAKPPLFLSSTFTYASAAHAKAAHAAFFGGDGPAPGEESGFIYARLDHPNLGMVQRRLAALDGAEDAAAFASGMAAVSAVLLAFARPGDAVLHTQPIYGGVDWLLGTQLAEFGVHAVPVEDAVSEASADAAAEAAMAQGPVALIMAETPANPTAGVADIAVLARVAQRIGERQGRRPLLVVDNTFLGPFLQSPLRHGADLCLTSLTKYAGGHSDLLAGGVSGATGPVGALKRLRTMLGSPLDPHGCWLLLRSFETMALRTERACANAERVARVLRDHPKVAGVTYLGFLAPGSPARAVYDRQCRGAGSTFSFTLRGGEAEAFCLLDALRVLRLAVSLGGTETLICHPASTTHYPVPRERREAVGILDGTLRVSVGIEHPDDLVRDLARALEAV
jgi:cystathionine gamma-synthase/methionine-gamma-lyase